MACCLQFVHVPRFFYALLVLLGLNTTALAQVDPPAPGSVEYSLTLSNYTWVRIADGITLGAYVEDLISDYRFGQPDGRGRIGVVTLIGYDADYGR